MNAQSIDDRDAAVTFSPLVHIFDKEKYNRCGKDWNAFGHAWCMRALYGGQNEMPRIRVAATNIMRNIWKASGGNTFWTCCATYEKHLRPAGMKKSYVPIDDEARDELRRCDHMVFLDNIFFDVDDKIENAAAGVKRDENRYALEKLLQWMWRSALRDGKEVWIYIPSSRMRALLKQWLGQPLDGWERQALIDCASRGLDNGECADNKE